jgi:hypothetical protein
MCSGWIVAPWVILNFFMHAAFLLLKNRPVDEGSKRPVETGAFASTFAKIFQLTVLVLLIWFAGFFVYAWRVTTPEQASPPPSPPPPPLPLPPPLSPSRPPLPPPSPDRPFGFEDSNWNSNPNYMSHVTGLGMLFLLPCLVLPCRECCIGGCPIWAPIGKCLAWLCLGSLSFGLAAGLLDVPLVHGPDPVWSALQSQGHPVW